MAIKKPISALIFDWGDTIMKDFDWPGPMYQWEKVDWIPGAEAALKILSQQYTCIIATSADHSGTTEMKAALRRVDADKYFHYFFASIDLGYKKPDPRFFLAITRELGLDPAKTVMIGNNYSKDIVGAKEAGLQTVFYDISHLPGNNPAADVILHDMYDLIKVIPS
ncbi:MAG: HAD family hydrolase [Sphingobacteriia bacterium]|nr:HAD family hydrolase [Sphingobacteriia bacterium]